jgi:hypothetical protein
VIPVWRLCQAAGKTKTLYSREPETSVAMNSAESTPGEGAGFPPGLASLVAQAGQRAKARPVERWDPPYCGEIDMRIAADGTWHYRGSPISREALVRLFASILRREADGRHVLVTPVERVGIAVDDAPFVAVEVAAAGEGASRTLTFRTNVGDIVAAGPEYPLRFAIEPATGGLKPYLHVRGGLEALATRALALELVAIADQKDGASGLWSSGEFFAFPGSGLG